MSTNVQIDNQNTDPAYWDRVLSERGLGVITKTLDREIPPNRKQPSPKGK